MTHPCAVVGCPWLVPTKLLLCAAHWRQVPRELKSAVFVAWVSRQAAVGGPRYALAAAHHEAVKRVAVEAVATRRGEEG